VKPRPPRRLSQWARATCSDAWWTRMTYFKFQCHIDAMWHWKMSHGTWLNLDK